VITYHAALAITWAATYNLTRGSMASFAL